MLMFRITAFPWNLNGNSPLVVDWTPTSQPETGGTLMLLAAAATLVAWGADRRIGWVVAAGSPEEIMRHPTSLTGRYLRKELEKQYQFHDLISKSSKMQQVFEDPHVKARGVEVRIPHPRAGSVPALANPARLSDTPPAYAAIQDPLGNAVHAVFRADCVGKKTAVYGLGPVGLLAIATLQYWRCSSVLDHRPRHVISAGYSLMLTHWHPLPARAGSDRRFHVQLVDVYGSYPPHRHSTGQHVPLRNGRQA